MNILPLFLHLT